MKRTELAITQENISEYSQMAQKTTKKRARNHSKTSTNNEAIDSGQGVVNRVGSQQKMESESDATTGIVDKVISGVAGATGEETVEVNDNK